jgi:hypothetical protein
VVQLSLIVALVVAALAVAWVLQRRTRPEPAPGPSWNVPALVTREAFVRPDAPWLVVLFSSSTCLACQGTWEKISPLESDDVAIERVDSIEQKDVHDRYGIDAVPMTLIVDLAGTVRRDFVGPVTATDLWAAVAELREPGSVPPGCDGDICG